MLGTLKLAALGCAASALLGFAAAWSWQGARADARVAAMEAEHAKAQAQAEQTAREIERVMTNKLREAHDAATINLRSARADADRARGALERLRDSARGAAQTARDTPAACPDTAVAFRDVFGACVETLRGMAEAADGHTVDVRKLIRAWPQGAVK